MLKSDGVTPSQPELSPEQLAERSQAGCSEAFARLVEQYQIRIFNFVLQFVRNRHDAEDVTQETFLKAYRGLHRYNSDYAFGAWLFTIAKRTAFSFLRVTQRVGTRSTVSEPTASSESDWNHPAVQLEQKDTADSIWRIAKALKPKQYEALWLRYGEGFSVAEIAGIMGLTQIHVKVLLHRGRSQLAKKMPSFKQ